MSRPPNTRMPSLLAVLLVLLSSINVSARDTWKLGDLSNHPRALLQGAGNATTAAATAATTNATTNATTPTLPAAGPSSPLPANNTPPAAPALTVADITTSVLQALSALVNGTLALPANDRAQLGALAGQLNQSGQALRNVTAADGPQQKAAQVQLQEAAADLNNVGVPATVVAARNNVSAQLGVAANTIFAAPKNVTQAALLGIATGMGRATQQLRASKAAAEQELATNISATAIAAISALQQNPAAAIAVPNTDTARLVELLNSASTNLSTAAPNQAAASLEAAAVQLNSEPALGAVVAGLNTAAAALGPGTSAAVFPLVLAPLAESLRGAATAIQGVPAPSPPVEVLPSPAPSPSPGPDPPSNTGAIVGGVVGGLLAAAAIATLVTWLVLRSKRRSRRPYLPEFDPNAHKATPGNTGMQMIDIKPAERDTGVRPPVISPPQTFTVGFTMVEVEAALSKLASSADGLARGLPAPQRAELVAAALQGAPGALTAAAQYDLSLQNYAIAHSLWTFADSKIWVPAQTAQGWLAKLQTGQVPSAANREKLRVAYQQLLRQLSRDASPATIPFQQLALDQAAAFLHAVGMPAAAGSALQRQLAALMKDAMICQLTLLAADPFLCMDVSGWGAAADGMVPVDSARHHITWRVSDANVGGVEQVLLCCKPGVVFSPSAQATQNTMAFVQQDVVTLRG